MIEDKMSSKIKMIYKKNIRFKIPIAEKPIMHKNILSPRLFNSFK